MIKLVIQPKAYCKKYLEGAFFPSTVHEGAGSVRAIGDRTRQTSPYP